MPEKTVKVTLEFTESEYRTLTELVREECPDIVTPEKYVYLETLKRLRIFLCGVTCGMDKMKRALVTKRDEALSEVQGTKQ